MRRIGGRPKGIFVTGTDTGVGKTMVACALAAWARREGIDVGVLKPVATGGRLVRLGGRTRLVSEDAIRLVNAAGTDDPWSLVNPICFREPLAPWTAALRARTSVSLPTVCRAFHALAARHDRLIVEGIGGLLVPLNARATIADVAVQLRLPAVLVARARLGTLNHTLLSLLCAERMGLPVRGILMNQTDPAPRDGMARVAQRTNPELLRRLTRVPVLGVLPFVDRRRRTRHGQAWLAEWIARAIPRSALERLLGVSSTD